MDFYTMNTPRDREINITELQKPAVNLFFIPIPTSLSELPPYWPFVVQSLSCVRLFATPWAAARQASLSFTSWSLLKLMSIELVMPSNHLILCRALLLLPSIFPSLKVLNYLAPRIRWPKCWSFSFSTNPSNEYSVLISFTIDWFDLLAVQGTLKSLLQHHSSQASILWSPDAESQLIEKDPEAGKDWGQEKEGATENEMTGWPHRINGHEFEQANSER